MIITNELYGLIDDRYKYYYLFQIAENSYRRIIKLPKALAVITPDSLITSPSQ